MRLDNWCIYFFSLAFSHSIRTTRLWIRQRLDIHLNSLRMWFRPHKIEKIIGLDSCVLFINLPKKSDKRNKRLQRKELGRIPGRLLAHEQSSMKRMLLPIIKFGGHYLWTLYAQFKFEKRCPCIYISFANWMFFHFFDHKSHFTIFAMITFQKFFENETSFVLIILQNSN